MIQYTQLTPTEVTILVVAASLTSAISVHLWHVMHLKLLFFRKKKRALRTREFLKTMER